MQRTASRKQRCNRSAHCVYTAGISPPPQQQPERQRPSPQTPVAAAATTPEAEPPANTQSFLVDRFVGVERPCSAYQKMAAMFTREPLTCISRVRTCSRIQGQGPRYDRRKVLQDGRYGSFHGWRRRSFHAHLHPRCRQQHLFGFHPSADFRKKYQLTFKKVCWHANPFTPILMRQTSHAQGASKVPDRPALTTLASVFPCRLCECGRTDARQRTDSR